MVQSSGIQKLVSKRQTNSEKSKKLKFDELLSKKNTFLQLVKLHTVDLSNITFDHLCVDSPN